MLPPRHLTSAVLPTSLKPDVVECHDGDSIWHQPVAFRNPLIVRVLGLQIIDFGDAPNVIVLFD